MEPDEYDYDRNNEAAKPMPKTDGGDRADIAIKYVPCRCDDAYSSRGLAAPDCPYHSTDPESAMEEYAEVKSQEVAIDYLNWWINEDFVIRRDGNFQDGFDMLTPAQLFLKYKQSKDR